MTYCLGVRNGFETKKLSDISKLSAREVINQLPTDAVDKALREIGVRREAP